jgi:translation initiation factor IF-2
MGLRGAGGGRGGAATVGMRGQPAARVLARGGRGPGRAPAGDGVASARRARSPLGPLRPAAARRPAPRPGGAAAARPGGAAAARLHRRLARGVERGQRGGLAVDRHGRGHRARQRLRRGGRGRGGAAATASLLEPRPRRPHADGGPTRPGAREQRRLRRRGGRSLPRAGRPPAPRLDPAGPQRPAAALSRGAARGPSGVRRTRRAASGRRRGRWRESWAGGGSSAAAPTKPWPAARLPVSTARATRAALGVAAGRRRSPRRCCARLPW